MRLFLKIVLLGAIVGLLSCEKISQPSKDANWWERRNFIHYGIESVETGLYSEDISGKLDKWDIRYYSYNRNGTLACVKGDTFETRYTYNFDGTLNKQETVYFEYDKSTQKSIISEEESIEYEYNNPGKYVITFGLFPTELTYLCASLIPNLSRITQKRGDTYCISDYTFDGDMMTISFTSDTGDSVDPIFVEYHGKYPYQGHNATSSFGPIFYQDNGMFKAFAEDYYFSWKPTEHRVFHFLEGWANKMLIDKVVVGDDVSTYLYNEHGDCIKVIKQKDGVSSVQMTWDYKYDSKGNVIDEKQTEKGRDYTINTYRIIKYY